MILLRAGVGATMARGRLLANPAVLDVAYRNAAGAGAGSHPVFGRPAAVHSRGATFAHVLGRLQPRLSGQRLV